MTQSGHEPLGAFRPLIVADPFRDAELSRHDAPGLGFEAGKGALGQSSRSAV
jgi:hypothetical protein